MVHLVFLLTSFSLVALGQWLLLGAAGKSRSRPVRSTLVLLGLALPVWVLLAYTVTMVPPALELNSHPSAHADHGSWLLSLVVLAAISTPLVATFLIYIGKFLWLLGRTYRNTWPAPAGFTGAGGARPSPAFRLWYSPRPFAFNLPGLLPGLKPVVVFSTALVEQLNREELRAVVLHERNHLARHDFWVRWLAGWWRVSFFYLPAGRRLMALLEEEQELACDEAVASQGGLPLTLALADALLKVWEVSVALAGSERLASGQPGGLGAAGLMTETEVNLTERRVNRLIEYGSGGEYRVKKGGLAVAGLLGGSTGVWLSLFGGLHLLMVSLGCSVALGLI